jgi:hypothetical protein
VDERRQRPSGSAYQCVCFADWGFFTLARAPAAAHRQSAFTAANHLWLGWGAASLIWSVNRYDSEMWLLYASIGALVFTITASLTLAEKAKLLGGYVWIAVAVALYGFYLYLTGDYGRLTSSFYWANPCAAFLLPAAFITGWRWLTDPERTSARGWLRAAQVLVLSVAVWQTDSRGAILAAARGGNWGVGNPACASLLAAAGGNYCTQLRLKSRRRRCANTSCTGNHGDAGFALCSGSGRRVDQRRGSLELPKECNCHLERPSADRHRAGTFGVVHPQYQQRVISAGSDAHNIFAQTLAEQGLTGLLILIYLLIAITSGVIRGSRREPQLAVVAVGAAVLLIHFGLDIDDRYPALITLLAMLAGACYQTWIPRVTRAGSRSRIGVPPNSSGRSGYQHQRLPE